MRSVHFTLGQYLAAHGLTAYRLAEAAQGRVSRKTVYALARGAAARVDLATLGAVITTLEELTGQEVTPADLLEARQISESSLDEWENADLMPLLSEYDWGAGGESQGEAVRYIPGVGFVAGPS